MQRGGKKAVKIYYLDYCLTKVMIVVPPCWHRNEFPKWAVLMALGSSNILIQPLPAYITNMNHQKGPFKSFLCISKLLYLYCTFNTTKSIDRTGILLFFFPPTSQRNINLYAQLHSLQQCLYTSVF